MIPAKPTGNQATTSLGTVTVETENFQSALLSNVTGLVGNLQLTSTLQLRPLLEMLL